jgi:hypothetical protein
MNKYKFGEQSQNSFAILKTRLKSKWFCNPQDHAIIIHIKKKLRTLRTIHGIWKRLDQTLRMDLATHIKN